MIFELWRAAPSLTYFWSLKWPQAEEQFRVQVFSLRDYKTMHNITVDAKENAMFVSSMEVQTLKYRSENLRLCC